ncbi:VanZ family protein [Thalassomonas sp. M1454]|uniref:VanZ family protein n=1 Tax=Thalassomonas sp. M1454 TaxID=2594477 RepID=UPI00117F93F1|nr:VanZ family protein [Thalassomonas sp. M1454]TRX55124.1 trypsin [Thalassomonas sp. M1454]
MKYLAILGLFLLCFVQFRANAGQDVIVESIKNAIPFGDKVGHFFMYGLLAFAMNFALKFRSFGKSLISQHGAVVILMISSVEEFSQMFVATRTFSLLDLTANFCGVLVFTWLAIKVDSYAMFNKNTISL